MYNEFKQWTYIFNEQEEKKKSDLALYKFPEIELE